MTREFEIVVFLTGAQPAHLYGIFENPVFLYAHAVSSFEAKGHRHQHHDQLPRSRPEVIEMTFA